MKSNHQLAARFREVLLNGTWVANTNYKDQLQNLPLQLAQTKVGGLNTIAILAQHIHYYIQGVANVFKGGPLEIRDADSFDFPAFALEAEWQSFLKTFFNDAEEFATLVSQLPENMLNNDFVDKKYGTYQRNIEGMIEHCYYHLGQLVLIKKLTSNNYTPN